MSEINLEGAGRPLGKLEQELISSYTSKGISRRSFLVRGSYLGLSAAFLGSIVAACGDDEESDGGGGGASGEVQEGGTLRVASQRPGSPLDPVGMDNLGTYTVVSTCLEYLCGPGEGAALAPMLAEEWSPNDDGSVWTFKIRKGVKWHDGGELTAADVVATLDRLSVGNLAAYIVEGAATAVDDSTVQVTLNAPDGQFPYQLSVYNPQSLITPADFATGTVLNDRKTGTGPFKLESYDSAISAVFVRNDEYWGGKPKLEKVEFIFSDDIDTQINGVIAGEADAIVLFAVVGGDALLSNGDVTVESVKGASHRQLWMNTREGNFTDVRVRQAVALGIDRQQLLDVVLQGRGVIGNDHPVAPTYEYFDASQAQRTRDIEKAKSLLAEAGKEGLAVTMFVPDLVEIPQLAELMQSQLKEIGMDVTLNVISTDTFYDSWCKVYDSTNEPAGCDGGEEFGIVDYGNRGTPDVYLVKAYSTGEWNSAHYVSEEFRTAVAAYQAALTVEDRKAPIAEIQRIANEDVPYVIPYFYDSLFAYKKNVAGIRATGLGHFYLNSAGFTS